MDVLHKNNGQTMTYCNGGSCKLKNKCKRFINRDKEGLHYKSIPWNGKTCQDVIYVNQLNFNF